MSTVNYRSHEPLYIVMVRQPDAERLLREWAQQCKCQVTIKGNRMEIFEQQSLSLFNRDWSHAWHNVVIWDCWNKRHIYHE